ncbi:MAG: RNA polymerase sigma factor [Microbacterium arborescens]
MKSDDRDADPGLGAAPDGILVARATGGDTEAFAALLHRHTPIVRAYVYRIVGTMSETDDVVQEAFLTAWRQLGTLRDPDAVKAWLMKIASREAYAHLRKRPDHATLDGFDRAVDAGLLPEAAAVRTAQLQALSRALDALPEAQRRCWLLREVGSLSYTEIAEEMNLPASTVRGNLARARAAITIGMEGWR